jgi:hypothetical protein
MARTTKTGLDYFPFDVDFFDDEKLQFISSKFGIKGELATIKLLCRIYRNGYFINWGIDEATLFTKRVGDGIPVSLLSQIVEELVTRNFFDKKMYEDHGVLTSRGIQKRYLEATKRRKNPSAYKMYALIPINADINNINADINLFDADINPQSKVKESKGEESKSKVNENTGNGQLSNSQPSNAENSLPLLTDISDYQPEDYKNQEQVTHSIRNLLTSFCSIEDPDKSTISSFANIVMNTSQVKNQTAFKYVFDTFLEFHSYSDEKRNLKYLYSRVKGRIDDALIKGREEKAKLSKQKEKAETLMDVSEDISQLANKIKIN